MALLLDSTGMPLGMNMYPGNQSEKPEIRKICFLHSLSPYQQFEWFFL